MEKWSRDGLYWLLRYGRKNDGGWNGECAPGECIPDESNVDLMVAAPKLLHALKEARDQLCSYSTDMYVFDMITMIDVVIKNAEVRREI